MASAIQDNRELSEALNFFANLANDVPAYRDHVLSSTGVTLLINNLRQIVQTIYKDGDEDCNRMCYALQIVSTFQWCSPLIIQHNVCPSPVELLVYVTFIFPHCLCLLLSKT